MSDDPSLPMPPSYTWKKTGPHVVSSFGYMRYSARQRGVAEFVSAVPKLKSERGWHALFDAVVGRAEVDTISRSLDDYLALCGAGYTEDGTALVIPHDRAIVVFWSLNDVCGGRGKWEYKMEHLARDVSNLARLSTLPGPLFSLSAAPRAFGIFLWRLTQRATRSLRSCATMVAPRSAVRTCLST